MSLIRVFGIWCLLAILMSAHGILRETVLTPALGAPLADALSAAQGSAIILASTWIGVLPLAPSRRTEAVRGHHARWTNRTARAIAFWKQSTTSAEHSPSQ